MMATPGSERLWRTVAVLALAVGIGFAVAPTRLGRLFGLPPGAMTGAATLGWQLFAVRNLVVGGAALRGSDAARRAILPVQLLDQAVFVHAGVTRSVPRPTALLAMATSGLIIAICLAARGDRQGT